MVLEGFNESSFEMNTIGMPGLADSMRGKRVGWELMLDIIMAVRGNNIGVCFVSV